MSAGDDPTIPGQRELRLALPAMKAAPLSTPAPSPVSISVIGLKP